MYSFLEIRSCSFDRIRRKFNIRGKVYFEVTIFRVAIVSIFRLGQNQIAMNGVVHQSSIDKLSHATSLPLFLSLSLDTASLTNRICP